LPLALQQLSLKYRHRLREANMKESITAEASRRRADVARQLADMAVCPDTKAFFLVLQQRWTKRPPTVQSKAA
jgi:hypothetical protein